MIFNLLDIVRQHRTVKIRNPPNRKHTVYIPRLRTRNGTVHKHHISCRLFPDDKRIGRNSYRKCCLLNPLDRIRKTDNPKQKCIFTDLFVNKYPILFYTTYLTTSYIKISDFALIAVDSGYVRFTLTLSGYLIASQWSQTRFGSTEVITIARFAVSFFGIQSVSKISCKYQ